MKRTFTYSVLIISLSFFYSCTRKQTFYLPQNTGSFGHYQKSDTKPGQPANVSLTAKPTIRDSVLLTASAQPGAVPATSILNKIGYVPESKMALLTDNAKELRPANRQIKNRLAEILPVKSLKSGNHEEKKPPHKLAKIGFGLGLASVGLLLLAPLLPGIAGVLVSLMMISAISALVTSRIALKDIKSNPEKFGGKGKAIAGFVIGLVVSLVFLIMVIIGLLFLALFFGGFN